MNERLQHFLKAENISRSQLADSLGVARASITHIISGRNKPGFDFLENISLRYPALNLDWLVTGRGKMYRNPLDGTNTAPQQGSPLIVEKQIDRIVVFFEDGTYREFK